MDQDSLGRGPPTKRLSNAAFVSSLFLALRSVTQSETVDTTSRAFARAGLAGLTLFFKAAASSFFTTFTFLISDMIDIPLVNVWLYKILQRNFPRKNCG